MHFEIYIKYKEKNDTMWYHTHISIGRVTNLIAFIT